MTMRLRCSDGDMAIIIREEPGCEANIGCVVEVHGPLRESTDRGPAWLIVPASHHPLTFVESDGRILSEYINFDDGIIHPDAWMISITPPPKNQERCSDKELEDVGNVELVT